MRNTEYALINRLLEDNNEIAPIYNVVSPDMFEEEILGRIYYLIKQGYDENKEVDVITISTQLSDRFTQEMIMEVIKDCMSIGAMSFASVKSYSDDIVSAYKARRLNKMLQGVNVTAENVNEQIRAIKQVCENLSENTKKNTHTMAEIANSLKDTYFTGVTPDRIKLGFEMLDEAIGGLEPGDVVVIGARPAVGKSALASQIANTFVKEHKRVGYFNLEMKEAQVYERFVSSMAKISLKRLRSGEKPYEDERIRFNKANQVLVNQTDLVITTGSARVSDIRNAAKNMNYDVIIVDYFQLVKSDGNYRGNRVAEVGAISKAFKELAMELNIPIILLSQLNRASEGRETKEPSMSELRESGDIEQDASVIILLWNTDENDRKKKGLKVEKNRQGSLIKENLIFDGEYMTFHEDGLREGSDKPDKTTESRKVSRKSDDLDFNSTQTLPWV